MKTTKQINNFNAKCRVTVIIPTYNRTLLIREFIEQCIIPYKGVIFAFEIHDSSSNNDTKVIFDALCHNKIGCSYFRYDSSIPFDVKQRQAATKAMTDYVYLLADGRLVDFNKLEEILISGNFSQYDVIDINSTEMVDYENWQSKKVIPNTLQNYPSLDMFFRNCFAGLTLMGAYFIKTNLLKYCFSDAFFNKYMNKTRLSWPHLFALFDGLVSFSKNNSLNYGFLFTCFSKRNPNKKSSGWQNGDVFFEVFFKDMYEYMKQLPGYSDEIKREALYSFVHHWGTMDKAHLRMLRKNRTITFKRIRKYKFYIKSISDSYRTMVLYSLTPRFLIHDYYGIMKKIFCK